MNDVLLIADSGSTKTDWLYVSSDGSQTELHTDGINPARDARDNIYNVLYHDLLTGLPQTENLQAVYFYGAGCIEPFSQTVKSVLGELFPRCHIEVESDLLGVEKYDGKDIVKHTPPLGYILGDEGSGSYLGKTLLNGLFKGTLPEELKETFCTRFELKLPDIIERVYRLPVANAFLASLVPFIVEHRSHPAIHDLLIEAFKLFAQKDDEWQLDIVGEGDEGPLYRELIGKYQLENRIHIHPFTNNIQEYYSKAQI